MDDMDMGRETVSNVIAFPPPDRKPKKLLRVISILRRVCGWLLFLGTLLFILSNYTLFTPSSLQIIAEYAVTGMRQHAGSISTIEYGNGSYADGALCNGGLAYADSDSLFIQQPGSEPSLRCALGYSSPAVEAQGEYVLAFDRGGTKVILTTTSSLQTQLELQSPILNGSVNGDGSFILVTAEQGYRTAITAYDNHGRETLQYKSSNYYIVSAALSPDGKLAAALGFRQDGATLVSRAIFLSMSNGERLTEIDLPDALGMALCFLSDNTIAVLCDDGVYYIKGNEAEHLLEISSNELLAFTMQNNAFALAVRAYDGKTRSIIYTLRGSTLDEPFPFQGEPSAVAISNAGVAVLSASGVVMYDRNFQPLWQNADAIGASRILLSNNGQIYALYAKRASLYYEHSINSEKLDDTSQSPAT